MSDELTAEEMKVELFNEIHFINFMYERRKESFQMQGRYDGSISEQCKQGFKRQQRFWDRLILEFEREKTEGEHE